MIQILDSTVALREPGDMGFLPREVRDDSLFRQEVEILSDEELQPKWSRLPGEDALPHRVELRYFEDKGRQASEHVVWTTPGIASGGRQRLLTQTCKDTFGAILGLRGNETGNPVLQYNAQLTHNLLVQLADAPSRKINSLFARLADGADPGVLLQVAMRLYSETGRQEYLDHTAALLEYMGAPAWPALESVASRYRPECYSLVHVIAHCDGVSEVDRRKALLNLAKNPALEVRERLFEAIGDLSRDMRLAVLTALADDVDEEIREAARERLESLT